MIRKSKIFIVFGALLFSSLLYGQNNSKPKVIFRKSESHKFSGLRLKGQLKKPELSYIYKRKGVRAEQIINIPRNFDEEIVNGAEQF